MPTFVPRVPVDLHKLLENRAVATSAFGRISRGIVEMTIDISFMFVVRVLWAEKRWTYRAREMLDVELLVCDARLLTDTTT